MSFDAKAIFVGLTKGIAHWVTGANGELAGDAAEVLAGLGLDSSVGDSAYLLIQRALFAAGYELARESVTHFQALSPTSSPKLSAALETKLEHVSISIERGFLTEPRSLPLLREIAPIYEQWLVDMGVAPNSASLICKRFDSYFVYALSSEWRKNHSAYKDLIDAISSPFGAAEDRERDWENYFAALGRRTNENIFDEPFSLEQIYVSLNAYYVEKKSSQNSKPSAFPEAKKQRVVDLDKELINWLRKRQKDDAIRVVSGGPGSGKPSFMKMFCAKVGANRLARPIYIPLHLIDPTRDIGDEVGRFLRDEGYFRFNPLDPDLAVPEVLLVFDGLDELASQGKIATQVAKDFVQAVERMVERRNLGDYPLLVLLSGRELVVQENETEFRKRKQVLTILPYFVPQSERGQYDDSDNLLKNDLRNAWWRKYGELTQKIFSGIPASLQKHEIDEITAQPLLNYLVALSFTRGRLDFEKSLNLNHVYADLVAAVYERGYEKNRIYKPISHIKQREFVRVLEEIGLAAWHGSDGRSTSVNEILAHCKESGLESLIKTFQEGAKAGITKLLAAFFFRQHGQEASGDATFVFTHKSFGEYLTALRIVRGIEGIVVQLNRRSTNPDDGYDSTEGLVRWVKLVGPAQMTPYIHRFLMREIQQRPHDDLHRWKEHLSELLSQAIEKHMPMEKLGGITFAEAVRQNNNASETLVIAVNACATVLRDAISLRLGSRVSFGSFIRRITPQRLGPSSPIVYEALSYFDFSGQSFDLADLYGAELSYTKWDNAHMHYANFATANLTGASLSNAMMTEIDLQAANLTEATVYQSKVKGAKLRQAGFVGARLADTDISFSDVSDASFNMTSFHKVRARGVEFGLARIPPADTKIFSISEEPEDHGVRTPPTRYPARDKNREHVESKKSQKKPNI
jgi:uncharacterized protein YjbI with pentapeptide repeats